MPTGYSITVSGQNTLADYYSAYEVYWSRMPNQKASKLGAIMLFIAGVAFVYFNRSEWPGYLMLVAAPVIFLNLVGRLQVYVTIRRKSRLTLPYEVTFDETGVTMKTKTNKSRMSWQQVVSYHEAADLFLLFPTKRTFLIYPKRMFSAKQIEELRKLLKRKKG